MAETNEKVRAIIDEARNAIASGATAAGAAAAAGATPELVATSGIAGAIPAVLATIVNISRGWKERDAKKWWHDTICGDVDDGKTPEEIAGIIDEHRDEPFVRETILRSLRALLDAPDECVVTPLALLAREYLREKKNPDYFFRGTCGMLMWCSRDIFSQLRSIADAVGKAACEPGAEYVRIESGQLRDGLIAVIDQANTTRTVSAPDGARIVRRLCIEELAIEIGAMDKGRQDNFAHCRVNRDPGFRFFKLVLA